MFFDKYLPASRRSRQVRDERLAARADVPTIIVEPARPIIQIPRASWWERIVPLVASAASAAVAVAALVFAVRSYEVANNSYKDQHITVTQAISASSEQYADKISSWILASSGHGGARLVVQNLSSTSVFDTTALIIGKDTRAEISYGRGITQETLGTIPPCSQATVQLSESTIQKLDVPLQFVRVNPLSFADVNGVDWNRYDNGKLDGVEPGAAPLAPVVSPGVTISPVPEGCS